MTPRDTEQDWLAAANVADLDSLASALPGDDPGQDKRPVSSVWSLLFALAGVLASVAAFTVLSVQFRQDNATLLAAQARTYHDALQKSLSNSEILLHALRATLHRTRPASAEEFASLTLEIRGFFPGLQVVSWTPRVKVGEIPAVERAAAAEGMAGFHIHNADGSSPGASLPPDADVFPIYYRVTGVGFHSEGAPPTGVNVTSLPGRRAILDRACASGDTLASTWPTLINQSSGFGSLNLYLAVYGVDPATTYPYQACSRLVGFLGAILRLDVLMATSFRTLPPMAADVYLLDTAAAPARQQVGAYPAFRPGSFTPLATVDATAPGVVSEWLELGGREFSLVFVPLPRHGTDWTSSTAWLMLVSGLFLTAALSVFFALQRATTRRLIAEAGRRRRVERALRASEYRLRLALRDSKVAVYSQDRAFRYTWVYNPNIGIAPQDMIGKRHADLYPVEPNREMEAVKQSVLDSGIGTRREVQLVVGDRHYFRDLRIEPLRDRSGVITGIICVSIDITEAKRMKEELSRAVAVAERANAAKSRFLAAASHDLRQPFQAMQLYQELLSMQLAVPRQQDICRQLGASIQTGRELLTALLDVSILDAGTITPKISDFPLQPSLESLLEEFSEQAARLGIALGLVPTSVRVRSDRVLLARMLRNLVTNAVRYTRSGRILIGCRRRGCGREVEIQVWDTGIGIAADQLELIFEDFFQVGNSERQLAQGLGLGLGIVARTADLLGHRVAVRSWPGRGSVFSVVVATAALADPQASPQATQIPVRVCGGIGALSSQRVLILEDNDGQRRALRLLLEESGHSVTDAATLEDACRQVDGRQAGTTEAPTLIISDFRLPGAFDGIAAIAELRRRIGREVPALLVTGDTARERLRDAAAAGLAILHKPFDHDALLLALHTVVTAAAAVEGNQQGEPACP